MKSRSTCSPVGLQGVARLGLWLEMKLLVNPEALMESEDVFIVFLLIVEEHVIDFRQISTYNTLTVF